MLLRHLTLVIFVKTANYATPWSETTLKGREVKKAKKKNKAIPVTGREGP
jgi:hypothetical protein